jgi:hypothetical protein
MGVKVTRDNTQAVLAAIRSLTKNEVLIGIPAENIGRREGGPVNNAVLGYVHEFGSPARNIPPRPFLVPGVASIKDQAAQRLGAAMRKALDGDRAAVDKALHDVGLLGQAAVRQKITDGPFVPLKLSTLKNRLRKHPSRYGLRMEIARQEAGEAPNAEGARPLIDTAQMRNAVSYVIRGRK